VINGVFVTGDTRIDTDPWPCRNHRIHRLLWSRLYRAGEPPVRRPSARISHNWKSAEGVL